RLDDLLRSASASAATPLLVARDQRLVELALDAGALAAAAAGALQPRRVDSASAEARALCEAWLSG
ncbi:MAG TPA: hypothetical protein VNS61_01430, partial [Caldimonas sp.]|nr:hypothetical protein [Caldimonas sp.]